MSRTVSRTTELLRPSSRGLVCGCALLSMVWCSSLVGQTVGSQPSAGAATSEQHRAEVEKKLNDVTAALNQTRETLVKSLHEIERLQAELDALRAQAGQPSEAAVVVKIGGSGGDAVGSSSSPDSSSLGVSPSGVPLGEEVKRLGEEQAAMQAEIQQHEQTKVESESKYPVRLTGLVLFQAFSNAGVVDNIDLPSVALPRGADVSHGSVGASMRQTLIGLEATGPRLWGARTSADVSVDFFGDLAYSYYNSSAGSVRLRRANVGFDWDRTSVGAGINGPLISPLSPTSFATVAQPSLAWAGNLWTWSPQLRVEQRVPISGRGVLGLEAGLWDPQPIGLTSSRVGRVASLGESARRPGYEGRLSYRRGQDVSSGSRSLILGVGAYSSAQLYEGVTHIQSWAVTGDWQIPMGRGLELSGEAYRGSSLGNLGGGAYKDILIGTDAVTGAPRTNGVDAVGGWSQLKMRFGTQLEANGVFGLDDAFASNFHRLVLLPSTYPLELSARNSMVMGNLIFRPKTYLIFSPEYRRIMSWQITGPANIANIFTLSAGYHF